MKKNKYVLTYRLSVYVYERTEATDVLDAITKTRNKEKQILLSDPLLEADYVDVFNEKTKEKQRLFFRKDTGEIC